MLWKILQGSEEGEGSSEILPYAMVLFDFPAGTGKVSVSSTECLQCLCEVFLSKKQWRVYSVPEGSWGDPTPSMVKAWKKDRKRDFIILVLFIFYCFFSFHWKEGFFFLSFQILLGEDFPSISFYLPVSEEQDKYFQQENPEKCLIMVILFIFFWCRVTWYHALTFDHWWWKKQCLFVCQKNSLLHFKILQ